MTRLRATITFMRKIGAATLGATLAVAGLLGGCAGNGNAPGSVTGKVVTAAAAAPLPPEAVPPYFFALTATAIPADYHPQDITVRSTRSGQVLATVHPPEHPGTFTFGELRHQR